MQVTEVPVKRFYAVALLMAPLVLVPRSSAARTPGRSSVKSLRGQIARLLPKVANAATAEVYYESGLLHAPVLRLGSDYLMVNQLGQFRTRDHQPYPPQARPLSAGERAQLKGRDLLAALRATRDRLKQVLTRASSDLNVVLYRATERDR
jgi:hypothetical protein